MDYNSIFLYFFSLFSATVTIFLSYRLAKRYPLQYLGSYLYFLVVFYLLAFIKLLLTYLAPDLLGDRFGELFHSIHLLLLFLVFPLIPVCIYFFLSFISGFLGRAPSRLFKVTFALFWALVGFGIVVGMKFHLENTGTTLLWISSLTYLMAVSVLFILVLGWTFLAARKELDKEQIRAVVIYSGLYTLCLIVYLAVFVNFSNPVSGTISEYLILFSMNLPPLVFLTRFLNKYYLDHPFPTTTGPDWQALAAKFNISKRECEIMRLLLKGRSSRDIEGELFISIKTVKNHISHIYKKLKIKNRIQLINLVNNFPSD